MKTPVTYLVFILLLSGIQPAADKSNSNLFLFKIQRSTDANEIYYEKNLKDKNKLNITTPINIYWVKPGEKGKKETLSWTQRKYAYGLNYSKTTENIAIFKFVSYKDREFTLKQNRWGVFKVFTISNKKEIVVNRIFLQIEGGTFWFPKITRIDIYGLDPNTNDPVIEIVHL